VTDEPLESLVSDVAHARIGKYEILRPLGSGAMGMVYLATDTLLERDVALKVMVPAIARDPEQKHRFEREAKAVARMTHPNVVTVYDFGYHHDGSPYIAMELLKGKDLQEVMREGSFELDRKVGIMIQVLDGLGHAHQAGIVHRDVKPANIFVRTDGTVKIMDFGVARLATSSMTGTGSIVGTADYMSPEQVKGEHVDGRSDLFSVGCMLFELLAGQRPFHADNLMTIFYRITHEEPNFGLLPSGASYGRLLPIVRRALGKTVADRYQSAEEFAAALRGFQRAEVAPPPTISLPAAPPPAAATAPPQPAPPSGPATAAPAPRTEVPPSAGGGKVSAALPRLLRDLYVGRKSGLLHFVHDDDRRSVRFRKGQIVNASSTLSSERLGEALLRHGLLAEPEIRRASELAEREGRRLGTALVEMGLLDRGKLEDALASQVRDILLVVFSRSDGKFSFEETGQEGPPDEETTLKLSTGEMILEAVRRVSDADAVRSALGDLDRVLALSTDPLLRFQKITFTPTDGYVLSRVDGILSAREVIQVVSLPQEEVERSLFGLLCTGVLEHLEKTRTRVPRSRKPGKVESPPEPPFAGAAQKEPSKPVDEAESRRAAEARRREVVQAHDGLKTRTHFDVLGIARNATEAQVKDAYFRLAKRFHPDVQHDPALADMHDKLEAIFIRLGEAYEVLRNAQSRSAYEAQLGPSGARPPTAQAPGPPPTTGRHAAAPSPPPAAPAEGKPQPTGDSRAQESIRSAEKLMSEEKYWDAIQILEQSLPWADGKALQRVRVLLARAYLKNPKWVKRAEEVLQTVVQEDPRNAEAYFVLGTIYKGGGLRNRAVSMFRKVMELQPGHEDAVAELTALGEEAGTQGGGGEGLIKKLFGKS
jgi:serine/threonine protein kinase/tetratricopeptide (TPR) repeat protein